MKSIFIFLTLLFSCNFSSSEKIQTIEGFSMGTSYTIRFFPSKLNQEKELIKSNIDKKLKEVNKVMSTYIKTSEISRFNSTKNTNWISVSKVLYQVTKHALDVAQKTNGVFDPTIGLLVNLWGFGPNSKKRIPRKLDINMAKQRTGYQKLILHPKNFKIRKKNPHLYLDLSASAKGYAVDLIAEYLKSEQIQNFMVEIGGEVRVYGKNAGQPWLIGIVNPKSNNSSDFKKVLSLTDMAVATSGNYNNFFVGDDGVKYSHTINPETGKPIYNKLSSVTVLAKTSMDADSWSTALMAMGLQKGFKVAEENNMKAIFIYSENNKLILKATEPSLEFIKK